MTDVAFVRSFVRACVPYRKVRGEWVKCPGHFDWDTEYAWRVHCTRNTYRTLERWIFSYRIGCVLLLSATVARAIMSPEERKKKLEICERRVEEEEEKSRAEYLESSFRGLLTVVMVSHTVHRQINRVLTEVTWKMCKYLLNGQV